MGALSIHNRTQPPAVHERAQAPILLAGSTRSGTTLLSLILGHHPEIAFVGELEWVWDCPDRAGLHERHAPVSASYREWVQMQRHFLHHHLRVDPALPFPQLAKSFLEQMCEQSDPQHGKRLFGCQLHRHYREALEIWPDARFIHLVRDGRDVCASWLKFGWLGNAYRAGVRWSASLDEWDNAKIAIPPEHCHELRFEDLIAEPVQEIQRLCSFLGVPYDDAMLRYHEHTSYGPIDASEGSKWRNQLKSRDVRLFEAVASHTLQKNGYVLSGEAPYALTPLSKAVLGVEDKLQHHRMRAGSLGPKLWLADIVARRIGPQWLRARVQLELNAIDNARMK